MIALFAMFSLLMISCEYASSESGDDSSGEAKAAYTGAFATTAIVRTVNNFSTHAKVVSFMKNAVTYHISTIDINVKEDEDDEVPSGYVFYNSSIAPRAAGFTSFDALADVITEAHSRGIKVRAWIPQFHDSVAVAKNASWQMMECVSGKAQKYVSESGEKFASPINPDCQAYERSIIKEVVTKYNVDGIILDWLRFDNWNMDVGASAVSQFTTAYGYSPLTINFDTDNTKRQQWQTWRVKKLGDYVAAVRSDVKAIKSAVTVAVYVLPPAATVTSDFAECGQDPATFASSIDSISPMAYFADWGYTSSWVYNTCIATTKAKVGSKSIIPGFDISWTNTQYHDIYSNIRTKYPEINTFAYFVYGQWTSTIMKKIDSRRLW